MTARNKYVVGSIILAVAVIILVIEILGMTSVIPKWGMTRELNLLAIVLVVIAGGLRRRARAEMAGAKVPPAG
jgi:hypothetical protein